jgi:hypothetical protein
MVLSCLRVNYLESEMDKQALIDKAVEDLKGKWPDETGEENHLYRFYGGRLVTGVYSTTPSTPEYVCNKEQFQQRARELGLINGVKQENKVPTPYGVLKFGGQPGGMGAPDTDDWYDYETQRAIKLPPVGVECEVLNKSFGDGATWLKCNIHWIGEFVIVYTDESCSERCAAKSIVKFRPLDHATRKADIERKRVVDALKHDVYLHAINRVDSISMKQSTGEDVAAAVIGYLHDKGYLRMLEDK